jgi:hypothetical protein
MDVGTWEGYSMRKKMGLELEEALGEWPSTPKPQLLASGCPFHSTKLPHFFYDHWGGGMDRLAPPQQIGQLNHKKSIIAFIFNVILLCKKMKKSKTKCEGKKLSKSFLWEKYI